MDGQAEHRALVVAVCVFIVVQTEGGVVAWDLSVVALSLLLFLLTSPATKPCTWLQFVH